MLRGTRKPCSTAVVAAAENVLPTFIIEGVRIDNRFIACDLLLVDRLGFASTPYWLRYAGLQELLPPNECLQIADMVTKTMAKAQLLERLRMGEKKGFVFRRSTAKRLVNMAPDRASLLKHAFDRST
jgi:hypothetical protein